jgi:hypothetical protein
MMNRGCRAQVLGTKLHALKANEPALAGRAVTSGGPPATGGLMQVKAAFAVACNYPHVKVGGAHA